MAAVPAMRVSLVVLLFALLTTIVCAQTDANIGGKWKSREGMVLVLNADGSGTLDGAPIKYTVRGSTLSLNDSGTVNSYKFELKGNRMTLSGGDLNQPMMLEREAPRGGLGARRDQHASGAASSAAKDAAGEPPAANTRPATTAKSRGIVGDWQGPKGLVSFRPDGSLVMSGVTYRYTIQGDTLTLIAPDGAVPFRYELAGDSLKLAGAGGAISLRRESAGASDDPGAGAEAAPAGAAGIVGEWQSAKGIVRITADGAISGGGTSGRYTLNGDTMTITSSEGTLQLRYAVAGDTLTLTGPGGQIPMRRLASGGKARVMPELAGKWCSFSSTSGSSGYGGSSHQSCFTLYPDGRYEYHAEGSMTAYSNVSPSAGVQPGVTGMTASTSNDAGTWSATATTITAVSRVRGTTTTYSLEKKNHEKNNDPMLCLDGMCFVTAYQKAPWR